MDRLALMTLKLLVYCGYESEVFREGNILSLFTARIPDQKAKCVGVLQWSELIPVVGWLGQKSQNATKQLCLAKQF